MMLFAGAAFSGEKNFIDGGVLVIFRAPDGATVSAAALNEDSEIRAYVVNAAEEVGAEVVKVYETLSEIDGNIFALLRSKTKTAQELMTALKERPDVVKVSLNRKSKSKSIWKSETVIKPNDPSFDVLWGLKAIRAPEAWEQTTGGENIYVAVLDSGFEIHEDLKANLAVELGYNALIEGNRFWSKDVEGHGTHVAGTIGAVGNNGIGVVGVNWATKIIPMQLLPDSEDISNELDPEEIKKIEAKFEDMSQNDVHEHLILVAVNHLASLLKENPDMKIAAVNMSLGLYLDETPEEMKDDVFYQGFRALDSLNRVLIVVSAGNEGFEVGAPVPFTTDEDTHEFTEGQYVYPASFSGLDNMLVVGATASDDSAWYASNWGAKVDIAAPGKDVYSTYSISAEDAALYTSLTGTSMSAPHVTGAATLLLAKYPNATASQIKHALINGANKNINPTVHPFNYDTLLRELAESTRVPYETLKGISRDITLEQLESWVEAHNDLFTDETKEEFLLTFRYNNKMANLYANLDGKGNISNSGLLDVKAAMDILASEQNIAASSSGCNTGFESMLLTFAAVVVCMRLSKS